MARAVGSASWSGAHFILWTCNRGEIAITITHISQVGRHLLNERQARAAV